VQVKRVVSGQRPTGKLHLGHLHGTLNNWIDLQANKEYDCFFFCADWHALTTNYEDVGDLQQNTYDMVTDWLALGLDPDKSTIYRQSDVPEVAQLHLYLSMVTTLGQLYRVPTYKEQLKEIKGKEIHTYGFLGYPVLQTADIVLFGGQCVPVGEDQLPHLELAREIVRRFNNLYGDTFFEPAAILSKAKKVLGTDGRKMSKSYNNAIYLADEPEAIRKKVAQMVTDPKRIKKTDPGDPEACSVFDLHRVYSQENLADVEKQCRGAMRGCVDCKKLLAEEVAESLNNFRKLRAPIEKDPMLVKEVLKKGAEKAKVIAEEKIKDVRKKMNI